MPTNMKSEYASVPKGERLNRTSFNLSHRHLTTHHGGILVPITWKYFYPGEVVKGSVQAFVRASSPLDFPLMDNLKLTVHWYAVPLRILWTNFRKFFGEREDPADSISYTVPKMQGTSQDTSTGTMFNQLARHLGIPVQTAAQGGVDMTELSALPFRAYNAIWNWHYRDAQIQDSVTVPVDDGPDPVATYATLFRGKRHDYFTSNLPAPQRGEAVTIGGEVAMAGAPGSVAAIYSDNNDAFRAFDTPAGGLLDLSATAGSETYKLYPNTTINELRNAAAIQQFLEKDNRYGDRFDDLIYSHYGVEFNDVRIAPVFLGGGSGYITTTSIPNNSGTTGNLGDLAAIATGALDGANFTYAFDEPGILMGIANVSADINYFQGINREWFYDTRYDFFTPEFVGIGDQATLMRELYYGNDANDETVFGYLPRYEELRTSINRVSGEFDPNDLATLETWHLAEELGSLPALNDTFIKDSTPYSRMLQVTTQDHFLADYQINLRAARALPQYGVPGLARL